MVSGLRLIDTFSLQFPLLNIYHFLLCPLGTCVIDQEKFNAITFDCSFWTLVKYRVYESPFGHFMNVTDGLMEGPHEQKEWRHGAIEMSAVLYIEEGFVVQQPAGCSVQFQGHDALSSHLSRLPVSTEQVRQSTKAILFIAFIYWRTALGCLWFSQTLCYSLISPQFNPTSPSLICNAP
jgi:hypothetical protein